MNRPNLATGDAIVKVAAKSYPEHLKQQLIKEEKGKKKGKGDFDWGL